MLRRHPSKDRDSRYGRLARELDQAEAASERAAELLDGAIQRAARFDQVRAAYRTLGAAVQEPLPAAPALDRARPAELTSRLSTIRTRRQWYLMSAPPGALTPAVVRPTSRAPSGPHVAGLEADFAERAWGVDLARALDQTR